MELELLVPTVQELHELLSSLDAQLKVLIEP